MTEKVDRKVEKETTKKWEEKKKNKKLQGLRSDRNLGPPSRVSTEIRKKKKKEIKKANGTMER